MAKTKSNLKSAANLTLAERQRMGGDLSRAASILHSIKDLTDHIQEVGSDEIHKTHDIANAIRVMVSHAGWIVDSHAHRLDPNMCFVDSAEGWLEMCGEVAHG